MKRFLPLVFSLFTVFILLTLAYDAVNLALIRGSTGNTAYKMERLFSRSPEALDAETPIIGSSRACGNYVPSLLGTDVFNYGINGSCIRETIFQLDYLVRHKRKGTIIVNLDPWGYAYWGEGPASGFAGNYRLAALQSHVREILPTGLVSGADWWLGVRFQGKLRANLTAYLNVRKSVTQTIDRGAVLLKNSRTEAEWKVINAGLKSDRFVPPNSEASDLLSFPSAGDPNRSSHRSLCIVWVVAPCSRSYHAHFENDGELRTYLCKLGNERLSGIRQMVIDRFTDNLLDDAFFADPTHLNQKGAEAFSREVRERLLNLGNE